jgi:hypothetical protein
MQALAMDAPANDVFAATVVTAANQPFWRCLYQFLRSAERVGLAGPHRFIAYDLGLGAKAGLILRRRFPWCEFRRFPFEDHPPHVAVERNTLAWKPIIVATVLAERGGLVLWLDSATLFKSGLDDVIAVLMLQGTYTLKGQTPLARHCDPLTLSALAVPDEVLHVPERAGGVVGLNAEHAGARKLAQEWRSHALVEAHISPRTPRLPWHRSEQSLLTILLHRLESSGELVLNDDEIDISSRAPVRWMTSRNKIPASLPLWADPLARAYYWSYKTADRLLWRLKHWHRTRIGGLQRWRQEHFSVFLARAGSACAARVQAPGWSYLADPFLVRHDGRMWLFAEEFRYRLGRGRLCAMALDDALRCGEPRELLALEAHASFPYPFEHEGRLYLLPETHAIGTVDLYRCDEFPQRWRLARRILHDVDAADSIVFRRDGYWWLLTSLRDGPRDTGRHLAIYYSEDLLAAPFHPHPVNAERRYAGERFSGMRNAGAPVCVGATMLRPVQRNRRYYGEAVSFMRIDALTTTEFRETEAAALHPLAALAQSASPHHVSMCGDILAWDVRDRVGRLTPVRPPPPRPPARPRS